MVEGSCDSKGNAASMQESISLQLRKLAFGGVIRMHMGFFDSPERRVYSQLRGGSGFSAETSINLAFPKQIPSDPSKHLCYGAGEPDLKSIGLPGEAPWPQW